MSVNTITPEPLEISSRNFQGIILYSQKAGQDLTPPMFYGGALPLANDNERTDEYDTLRCAGGGKTSVMSSSHLRQRVGLRMFSRAAAYTSVVGGIQFTWTRNKRMNENDAGDTTRQDVQLPFIVNAKGAITSKIKHAIKLKQVLQDWYNCCSISILF